MSEIKRCALLDSDFISRLYITKASDSDRLIFRILSIEDFHFVCHKQTSIELARHNQWASKWLDETSPVTVYTDRDLIQLMANTFGATAYRSYVNMLHRSCDFSSRHTKLTL